ncbi:MAG TPA: 30S ribosomal protein S20 [Clostridiales bacterium]|nr:30S ribosomal protein S20 [Clostridiales bacterium]
MPKSRSAKKRVLLTAKRTLRNRMTKSAMKTAIKKFLAAVQANNYDAAIAAYKVAIAKIDRAATKGIIAKNNAARKKSRFTRALNAMRAAQ